MLLEHHPPSAAEETLLKALQLVDEETGVIRLLYEAPIAPDAPRIFGCGAMCSDDVALGYYAENSVNGSTSLRRNQAIVGAVGEAVERYSAAFVPHEEILLRTYDSVRGDAVDPATLALYGDDQYARDGFVYKRFDGGTPIGWASGYSLTHDRPVLVPAFAVYQPYRSAAAEPPTIQQITTGLACGNTIEEAILAAICEVVERDAAMLMWIQSRRPPAVIMNNAGAGLCDVVRRFGTVARFVQLLDVTTDLAIPAYVAVWDGPIAHVRGAIFASCANPDPDRAAVGALNELAQCLMWAASLLDRGERIPDPVADLLTRIEEHVLWPLGEANREHYAFALSSRERVRPMDRVAFGDASVLQSILHCVERIAAAGLETIVVDVTSPDIRECGLHVVRVVIPGTQPLYFGSGMHRLCERARRGALNLLPHPFP